jgi:hypothetical protein
MWTNLEMFHYVLKTDDDYNWRQPSAKLSDSLDKAQLYEAMGRFGKSAAAVKSEYYTWLNGAVGDAIKKAEK